MNLNGRRYGHIRVEGILGQGGMGDVYEGYDEKLARRVALKVLHHESRLDVEARTRLMREARSLSHLDHPNICRIYDFIEDGDAAVLVLEMIDGRTLQQAIKDGLSRTEKLRIAHDVASVLVAAHRAGIIHRDLKPENVMLTRSGQVKVLDFGLARWLEQERSSGRNVRAISPAALAARLGVSDGEATAAWMALERDAAALTERARQTPADSSATAVGVTVGTPLFMSPEQARGEPLTTASDVYSFGLLLQALFTERDPYAAGLTANEVMLQAARGGALPLADVTHDVAALIKALQQRAPSDRPTAVDALQRIEAIIDTPKRMARRAALAALLVLLVLGVWKYTIDLRRERTAAQAAESEARRRRAQADSLIGFMLGDLRTKLEPVGKLDILDSVAARSLDYMSSLDTRTMTPQEIARNSKALNQLGEVRVSQANLTAAIAIFSRSLALAQAAHARAPNDPELALAVGTAHFWAGNAQRLKGDLAAALPHMREYRRITEDLAVRHPANDEYQIERAYGHSAVGTILEAQGDLGGTAAEYRTTLGIKSARLAAKPADAKRQADVAVTLNKLGFVLERLGQLAAARDNYQKEFAIYDALTRADVKDTHWQDRLANSHDYVSGVLESLGDPAALSHRQAAVNLHRALMLHDPANADWRRNLATSEQRHADLLRQRGDLAEAFRELAEAESIIGELIARDPAHASWRRDLALADVVYARALLASGQAAAAREKARVAVQFLSATQPASAAARTALADALLAAGDAEAAGGSRVVAEASWHSAVQTLQPLIGSTSDPRVLALVVEGLLRLGRAGEAGPLTARIHESGYRQGDFLRLLQHRR